MIKKLILFLALTLSVHAVPPSHYARYLVISGGGARGIVLLGAFETLLEIPQFFPHVECIVGSSVGAVTGAFLASGISSAQLAELETAHFPSILGKKPIWNSGTKATHFMRQHIKWAIQERLDETPDFIHRLNLMPDYDLMLYEELLRNLDPDLSIERTRITFEMLDLLHRLDSAHFKGLGITVTCINVPASHACLTLTAANAPRLDIAAACRASISLPLFLDPVELSLNDFNINNLPKELHKPTLVCVDGGWLNNTPVKSLEEMVNPPGGLTQVRQEAWVFVYEAPLKAGERSIFDPLRPLPSLNFFEKFMTDQFVPFFGKFDHLPSSTKKQYQDLVYLKQNYPYSNIISFPVDLSVMNFDDAAKKHVHYSQLGRDVILGQLHRQSDEEKTSKQQPASA